MKSQELQADDVLLFEDGSICYTVLVVHKNVSIQEEVVARVRYEIDGGMATRTWQRDVEVPHERPVLTECPSCDVTGPEVYMAEAHPTHCLWMMREARRCAHHDELLRPDELDCPAPDVPEGRGDPHGRRR